MFSFGHCIEGGGRPLPELKNTIYTFIFDGRKRCTSCPKEGEGGEVIRAMPERKHSFLKEVFPKTATLATAAAARSHERCKGRSQVKTFALSPKVYSCTSCKKVLKNKDKRRKTLDSNFEYISAFTFYIKAHIIYLNLK